MNKSAVELQKKFGMDGVKFVQLNADVVLVKLQNAKGRAAVSLYGAHVVEFQPANEKPVIFTSSQAVFTPGKAIRGGIPVCAPWFGKSAEAGIPAHGYARISNWQVVEVAAEKLVMSLNHADLPTPYNDMMLDMEVEIKVSDKLEVSLKTVNAGMRDFKFSGALHTYFSVDELLKTQVGGFENVTYLNALTKESAVQHGLVTASGEIDRIYADGGVTAVIHDNGNKRQIVVAKCGSASGVIWNPGPENAAKMSDFGNEEWHKMLCVEAANALADARVIKPGETHELTTIISLQPEA